LVKRQAIAFVPEESMPKREGLFKAIQSTQAWQARPSLFPDDIIVGLRGAW
jgi:hypothetical protein